MNLWELNLRLYTFCPEKLFFASLSKLLHVSSPVEIDGNRAGGKQTSIKVTRCVFSTRICLSPQPTVLAVGTTAVFPLDSGLSN